MEATAGQAAAKEDSYKDRLLKYIPAEVITLYLTLGGVLDASSHGADKLLWWIVFGFCLVGTPVYLWTVTKVRKPLQLVISTVSFMVWAFSIGKPFSLYGWYDPLYPALLLPAYTFLVPIIEA